MPEFSSFDGCSVSYLDYGAGRVVALLHGFAVDASLNWSTTGVIEGLVAAGYRLVVPDARGHGLSAKPHAPSAYAQNALVKDVAALVDYLSLTELALVGYSMGADTAVRVAAQDHRVAALVAGGVGGDLSDPPDLDRAGVAQSVRAAGNADAQSGGALADLAVSLGGDTSALAALFEGIGQQRSPALADVMCPSLVIRGDDDDMSGGTAESLAQLLPRGEAMTLSGLDHLGTAFDPRFAQGVVNFLSANYPATWATNHPAPPREREDCSRTSHPAHRPMREPDHASSLSAGRCRALPSQRLRDAASARCSGCVAAGDTTPLAGPEYGGAVVVRRPARTPLAMTTISASSWVDDHGDFAAGLQLLDDADLVLGEQLGVDLIHACCSTERGCRAPVVASEHDDPLHAQPA